MKKLNVFILLLLLLPIANFTFAQNVITNYTSSDGLPSDDICGGVAIAPDNTVWVGTSAGIAKFDGSVWTSYNHEDGLISDYCTCIEVDNNNVVWIGTDMGLSRFDGSMFVNFTTNEGLLDNTINYISSDQAGKIYIATYFGVSVFDGIDFQNITDQSGLPTNLIVYVETVGSNNVWFATLGEGAVHYNGTSFDTFNSDDGLSTNDISSIAVGNDQKKWIASYSGIDVLASDNQYFELQNHEDGLYAPYADGLYHDFVQDVTTDVYGNIWACVYVDYIHDGALSVYRNGSWTTVFTETNSVRDVRTDSNGIAWVATGAGVYKADVYVGATNPNVKNQPCIYPNPASSSIVIKNAGEGTKCMIFNSEGKEINSFELTDSQIIDVSNLPAGVYFVQLIEDNSKYYLNFVKN